MSVHELLKEGGPVLLEAYGHQVGGHSLLLRLGDSLCKPLLPREHFFYESIPSSLKAFTPEYHGIISVMFEKDENGEYQVKAFPKKLSSETKLGFLTRISHTALSHKDLPKRPHTGPVHDQPNGIVVKGEGGSHSFQNPWSRQCVQNTRKVLHQMGDRLKGLQQDYLVLEDLTITYQCPVILDLKIGTRQYGDDVSEEKKQLHIARCAHSTSNKLGVRICGLQLYDAKKDEYTFRDKYYGRDLSEENFYGALQEFLHNGVCFRSDLIPMLVQSLRELRAVILEQDSYRFFSSSLLLIYDGHVTPDLRGADARHCTPNEGTHLQSSSSPQRLSPTGCRSQNGITHSPSPVTAPVVSNRPYHQNSRPSIELRMIDFAHTTHSGYNDDLIKYSGPDEGYIVGLDTLIRVFSAMLDTPTRE